MSSRSRSRISRTALVTAVVVLAAAGVPAAARADGDPASDVLVSHAAFVPWDAGLSAAQIARLEAVVAAADRGGYPTHVALIASPSDLGSVTVLWQKPQSYAEYLGVELSLDVRGSVIVVMPDGDGVYDPGMPAAAAQAALTRSRARSTGGLAALAAAAVGTLASAAGHALPSSAGRASPGPAPGSTSAGVTAWVAVAVGIALIVLAWGASLRARPLRLLPGRRLPNARG